MTALKKKYIPKTINAVIYLMLILCALAVLFPVFFIVTNTFMSANEISESYGAAFGTGNSRLNFHFIANDFSLHSYANVFFLTPSYLMKFWNSLLISVTIMVGQVFISCLGGYGFAKFKFPFKNAIFFLIIILMMMPLQVTLVPNYIVLDKMGLIGSYAALIIPGIFSTFGIFLVSQIFSSFPDNMIEAAKIDGASHMTILLRIIIPSNKAGVASLVILNFIDNWNMVEQPIVLLKDTYKYPLSVFLSSINHTDMSIALVCGILAITPVFLLFLHLKDSLIYGIENVNLK